MGTRGRPRKEFDKKAFEDLCSLGCSQEEICWFFRDEREAGKHRYVVEMVRPNV